jgi:hypothetical protein
MCLVPGGAMAADGKAHKASKASEAKQDRAIRRNTRANTSQNRNIRRQGREVTALANLAEKAIADIAAVDGRINAIVPVVTTALTALQAGLTTAGEGLTRLGTAYQSVEFGRAAITVTGGGIAAGDKATSADIPDDGNVNTTGDDAIIRAGTTTVTVDLRALIRSAESDGVAGATAGQAGGFVQITNLDTGAGVNCAASPGTTPGGILGTTAGDSIVTPTGTVTNLPLKNIPGGEARTSTVEPTGTAGTSLLPTPCSFTAVAGDDFKVHWSVNFVDIPTSTTPGPAE